MKQEALAQTLNVSQQTVSRIEQTANLTDHIIERIAKALGITPIAIVRYDEQMVVDLVTTGALNGDPPVSNCKCDCFAIKKIIELYERLLEVERSRVL